MLCATARITSWWARFAVARRRTCCKPSTPDTAARSSLPRVSLIRSISSFTDSPPLVYAYVERRQIPHYRMRGRSIRFRLSELVEWRQQFHVNDGGIDEQDR